MDSIAIHYGRGRLKSFLGNPNTIVDTVTSNHLDEQWPPSKCHDYKHPEFCISYCVLLLCELACDHYIVHI